MTEVTNQADGTPSADAGPSTGDDKPRKSRRGMAYKESPAVRIFVIVTVVATLSLMVGLQWYFSGLDDQAMSRQGELQDATVELVGIHRAATQAGVMQVYDTDPAVLQAWLQTEVGPWAVVPDLSAVGLSANGARMLRMAVSNWSFIRYVDPKGHRAEVFLVAAPTGEVRAPKESVAEPLAGDTVYLDRVHGTGVVYLTVADVDWMAVTVEDDDLLRQLAAALLPGAG